MNRLHPAYGSYASDVLRDIRETQARERQESREHALNLMHQMALAVEYARQRGGMTDDEAESIAITCDEFGQSEPLGKVLDRMNERHALARKAREMAKGGAA